MAPPGGPVISRVVPVAVRGRCAQSQDQLVAIRSGLDGRGRLRGRLALAGRDPFGGDLATSQLGVTGRGVPRVALGIGGQVGGVEARILRVVTGDGHLRIGRETSEGHVVPRAVGSGPAGEEPDRLGARRRRGLRGRLRDGLRGDSFCKTTGAPVSKDRGSSSVQLSERAGGIAIRLPGWSERPGWSSLDLPCRESTRRSQRWWYHRRSRCRSSSQ